MGRAQRNHDQNLPWEENPFDQNWRYSGFSKFLKEVYNQTESLYIFVMFKINSISFCCRFAFVSCPIFCAQSTLERRLGILDSSMILLQDSAMTLGDLGICRICVINLQTRHRRILPLLQATTMATSIWRWEHCSILYQRNNILSSPISAYV